MAIEDLTDRDAASIVERFADAWSRMDPDAFTPLFPCLTAQLRRFTRSRRAPR